MFSMFSMFSMFTEELTAARSALEAAADGFDASCSGRDAVRFLEELGLISRLTDGMTAKVAKRIADTNAHVAHGDRSAAEFCARVVGVGTGEAKRAIDNAGRLVGLAETDAAVREGRLSAREAEMISAVAVLDPSVETELLAAAGDGLRPLQDACVKARARTEDQNARSERQHANRSLKMWNNTDGMVEGHFRLTPEVGGPLKSAIEEHTKQVFRVKWREGVRDSNDAYAADALAALVLGEPDAAQADAAQADAAQADGVQARAEQAGAEQAGAEQSGVAKKARAAGSKRAGGYTTHVVIDWEVLARGFALPGETCEIPGVGPVNAQWVREVLGEAFVTAIVKHGKDISTVAHLGRHIPAELRTAMVVSGRECSIEGCSCREYLELDHCEVGHAQGGPTARWNLAWLCSVHHERKTRGWRLGPPDPATGKRPLDPPGASRAA